MKKGSFGLNIQCPWRILKHGKLILGSNDIFMPINDGFESEFDWSEIGGSVFDDRVEKIIRDLLPLKVILVCVDEIGDLKIAFEKEVIFEVMPNSSVKVEFWRFINYKTNEHVVFYE